ncbi:MAG: S-methyl-5'-thioadenosine phosphorylase [Chloroflexi bacterium]|nr:S-methyl-5'-thioadenosine phosphorylase [Chloroflexota bacterium]
MADTRIAFIGGSGLYDMEGLEDREEVDVDTPFGDPSDSVVLGTLVGTRLAFLPRHGRGHRLSPTEIPARANIFALKTLGVERIVSISAVGSLQEEVRPLDMVVPDQLIDRTRQRPNTFFGDGIVAHVAFADPYCAELSELLVEAGRLNGITTHKGGTCVVMEGPQFSTLAESELYRSWGASIIGMTALPEAKLAREAEICYTTMALVTDYDCWHDSEESVTVEMIVQNLMQNVERSKEVVAKLVPTIPESRECACASALENAIITAPDAVPPDVRSRLAPLVGKYFREVSKVT